MRTPLLAVAGLAVHVPIRTIAGDDGVERFAAVAALVALAMPLATLREDLLGGKHDTAAPWATLSGRSLDGRRIHSRRFRGKLTEKCGQTGC